MLMTDLDTARAEAERTFPSDHVGYKSAPPPKCGCDECYVNEARRLAFVAALEAALGASASQDTEWEYGAGYQGDDGIEQRRFAMDGAFTVREAAEHDVARYDDPQVRLIRRRRPGPWVPVQNRTGAE